MPGLAAFIGLSGGEGRVMIRRTGSLVCRRFLLILLTVRATRPERLSLRFFRSVSFLWRSGGQPLRPPLTPDLLIPRQLQRGLLGRLYKCVHMRRRVCETRLTPKGWGNGGSLRTELQPTTRGQFIRPCSHYTTCFPGFPLTRKSNMIRHVHLNARRSPRLTFEAG